LKPDFVASWSVVVLHGLLTSVTAFEDFFAVLNGLLATMVLSVSVDASVFSENRWQHHMNV